MTVFADEERLDEIARPIVRRLWADELRDDIERALRASGTAPAEAFADLELGADESVLARAYVQQGAVDLSGTCVRHRCLCCVEDGLAVVPTERHGALVHETAVELVLAIGGDRDPAEPSLPRLSAAFLELDFEAVTRDVVLAQC